MTSPADLRSVQKQQLYSFLCSFISENKIKKFEENILQRTRHLTVVLEDIFQPHNASAVLRTCDCFGIQDVHIIENNNKYEVNPDVALGSSKWLSLFKHSGSADNTANCLRQLKDSGYRIIATTPHKEDYTPETLPLDQKTALVFGTEMEGLTSQALELADGFVRIPMYGFTESLNISVSAALLVRSLAERLRNSPFSWQLSPEESLDIRIGWARKVVKKADLLEKEFLKKFSA
jgi:tRNA (guanosine-2'-O-)-methyltransferase